MNLFLSILALALGPLIYGLVPRNHRLAKALDFLIIGAITAIVILAVLPDLLSKSHWWVFGFALVGFFGPTVVEQTLHRVDHHRVEVKAHLAALALGMLGIALHALTDGAVLATPTGQAAAALPLAVVLHRLPVGITIWWLLRPKFGLGVALGVLAVVVTATVVGYAVGAPVLAGFSEPVTVWFQVFVAGTLLHVVLFRAHSEAHQHEAAASRAVSE